MIKAGIENRKLTVEISGDFTDVREEMLRIGEAVRRIPDRKRRDELIHSDKEGEE